MPASPGFCDFVLDLLSPLGPVAARRMFGGYGLYLDGRMFALIAGDTLYFRTDGASAPEFEAAGLAQFRPLVKGKPFAMPYHEAPMEALEDSDALCAWAEKALAAAARAGAKAPRKARRR
jgi:DNA transformation protein